MPYAALRSHLIISFIHLHSIEKTEFMNARIMAKFIQVALCLGFHDWQINN